MGLYIQKNETRSKLQERVTAELREKAARTQEQMSDRPDGIEDSAYVKGTKKTTSLAGAWVVVILLAVVACIAVLSRVMS